MVTWLTIIVRQEGMSHVQRADSAARVNMTPGNEEALVNNELCVSCDV